MPVFSLSDDLASESLQMGFQFRHHFNADFTWQTQEPSDIKSWALAATTNAFSDVHVDASGLATWVHPILGFKVWYIGVNDSAFPNSKGLQKAAYKWHAFVLGPQDEL